MRRVLLALCALPLAAAFACSDSVDAPVAYEEPLRFQYVAGGVTYDAQFFSGDMPAPTDGPPVTGLDIGPDEVAPGTIGKSGYTVRLAENAYSVAVRLQGRTNGYWVARVSEVDVLNGGQVAARLTFDVASDMAPGQYKIEVSGIDVNQHFGTRGLAPLEVVPRIPSNATDVISLHWDAPVDLDLQLASPDGTFLSPKHPVSAPIGTPDAGTASGYGHLDGDSMASCVNDNYHQEDVIWTSPPLSGVYKVYVNPYSLCKQLGTAYTLTVTRAGVQAESYGGRISASEVQEGGFQLGTYVADVTF